MVFLTATYTQLGSRCDLRVGRLVHDTDIVEFELKSKRFSLSVRKKEALQAEQAAAYQVGGGPRKTHRGKRPGIGFEEGTWRVDRAGVAARNGAQLNA